MTNTASIFIRPFREDIRAALLADAERLEVSMNEVALRILAATYGIEYEPSGRAGSADASAVEAINLRMPAALKTAISHHAITLNVPQRVVVLRALAAHYGLEAEPLRDGRHRSGRRKTKA